MTERKIVGRKYVVVGEDSSFDKGEVLTLIEDDGSNMPLFRTGYSNYSNYVHMSKVLLLAEDEDEPEKVTELEVGTVYAVELPAHFPAYTAYIQKQGDGSIFRVDSDGDVHPVSTCSAVFYINNEPVPATPEQQIELLQAKVEHGDATEADLKLLSELMPLDNPELEVGEVYVCDGDIIRADVGDTVAVGLTGNFYRPEQKLFLKGGGAPKYLNKGYRKALPHEIAKLEKAEKEHGCEYQKPLINELGTVIEAGKYYSTDDMVFKVTGVNDTYNSTYLEGNLLSAVRGLRSGWEIGLNSQYGRNLVPATPEEIELFKQAEAREKLPKFEVGKKYTVWLDTFDCSVITVTRVDYSNDRITFKYKGKFGSYVSETQKISSEAMSTAAEIKQVD